MTTVSLLSAYLKARERLLVAGPPGCGKTAQILAAARASGYRVITMRASLSERIDFGGCMIPDTAAGVTRTLPLETLHLLRAATVPTLLFLDDLGQAPLDVQAAIMSLFDEGALPPNVVIWGATNRPGDKAGVSALCEPLRSRFTLKFNAPVPDMAAQSSRVTGPYLGAWEQALEGWLEWAEDTANAPAEILAWHRATGGTRLYDWKPSADPSLSMPDFRSWATAIRLWNAGLNDALTLTAALGEASASEFRAFASLASQLPTPQQIAMDPTGAPVPADPSAVWLVSTMLSQTVNGNNLQAFLTYLNRLPRVFGAFLGRSIFRKMGATLSGMKSWNNWFTANQDLFNAA